MGNKLGDKLQDKLGGKLGNKPGGRQGLAKVPAVSSKGKQEGRPWETR